MAAEKRDFDKEAAAWDEVPARLKLADDLAAAIRDAAALPADVDALDFGCGTGLVTLALQPHVRSVTGADSSEGMLSVFRSKIAQRGLPNVGSLRLQPDGSGALGGPYGLVVSSMTLHHVEHVPPLLARFREILSPGGRLCIADLDLDGGQFHADSTGVFHPGFDRGDLRRLFEEAGLCDVEARTASEVAKPGRDGALRTFTVFLMTGRRR